MYYELLYQGKNKGYFYITYKAWAGNEMKKFFMKKIYIPETSAME